MNATMIHHLMRKDWRLVRLPALLYFLAGLVALALLGMKNSAAFYAGTVLMITVLITLGIHPTINSVVNERKEGTLAFVMSLPISPRDYLWSKLLFNVLLYFVPWTILLLATCALLAGQDAVPDGMIPFVVILFGAIGVNAVLILGVAVVTESMEKTLVTMALCNLAFHGVFYGAGNMAGIKESIGAAAPVWTPQVFAFLAAYVAIIVATFAVTLVLQSRKTDFL